MSTCFILIPMTGKLDGVDVTSQFFGWNIAFLFNHKLILVNIRRWSYQQLQDDNKLFWKMKNDLTAGTWKEDIWCPINIILFCTSDEGYQSCQRLGQTPQKIRQSEAPWISQPQKAALQLGKTMISKTTRDLLNRILPIPTFPSSFPVSTLNQSNPTAIKS